MRPSTGFFSTLSLLILTTWAAPTINNNELGEVSSFHPGRPTSSLQDWDDWKAGYEEPQGPSRLKREQISKRTTGVAKYWSEAECKKSVKTTFAEAKEVWNYATDESWVVAENTMRGVPGLYELLIRFMEYYARVDSEEWREYWKKELDEVKESRRGIVVKMARWKLLVSRLGDIEIRQGDLEGLRQLTEDSILVIRRVIYRLEEAIDNYRGTDLDSNPQEQAK